MKIFLQKPAPTAVADFLGTQKALPFSYDFVGLTAEKGTTAPSGFGLDDHREFVGHGREAFEKAKKMLENWAQFPAPFAEILPDSPANPTEKAPLEIGQTVGMNSRLFGLHWLCAARIVYKINENARFGFAYGTLPGHFERGEELFLIEKTESGEVFFTIRAISQPKFLGAKIAYPFARFCQKKFVAQSFWNLKNAVGQAEKAARPAPVSGYQTALFGFATWLVFAFLSFENWRSESLSDIFVALAALVLAPLAVEVFEKTAAKNEPFLATKIEKGKGFLLPAAAALIAGLWLKKGLFPTFLSSFWLVLSLFFAFVALARLIEKGKNWPSPALLVGLGGLIFWPVGAAWATAFCLGFQPLGFSEQITGLTAVHFHFAGLFLPVALGSALAFFDQKTSSGKAGKVAVFATLVAMPATAVGITYSHLGKGPFWETLTASAMAVSGILTAVLLTRLAFFEKNWPEKGLFGLAAASLAGGMTLAFLYAVRSFWPTPGLDIPAMRMLHGTLNSVGFAAPALVGLCWKSWRGESR